MGIARLVCLVLVVEVSKLVSVCLRWVTRRCLARTDDLTILSLRRPEWCRLLLAVQDTSSMWLVRRRVRWWCLVLVVVLVVVPLVVTLLGAP